MPNSGFPLMFGYQWVYRKNWWKNRYATVLGKAECLEVERFIEGCCGVML